MSSAERDPRATQFDIRGGVSGARIPNYRRSRIDIRGTIRWPTSYKRRRDNIKQVQGLRGPVGESHTGHAPEHASFTVAGAPSPPFRVSTFLVGSLVSPSYPPCLWILKGIAEPRSGSGRAFKRNRQMSFVVAPVKSPRVIQCPAGQIRLLLAAA